MRLALLFSFVLACGPAARSHDPATGTSPTDGTQGATCAWGHREPHPDTPLAACHAGLSCCYPCGIDGCNSVCATADECKSWSTLP